MRSPALALAWLLWRRHHVGLVVLAVLWVALPLLDHLLIAAGVSPKPALGWTVLPFLFTWVYVVTVFSFAPDANLALPASGYPAHLFRLPVSTRSLVLWPMLFGTVAMVAFGVVFSLGFAWPEEVRMRWWSGLGLAAFLSWMQATFWLPVPTILVRFVMFIPTVFAPGAAVAAAFQNDVPEWVIAIGVNLALLAAYGVAFVGVRRARYGETPQGLGWSRRIAALTHLLEGWSRPYSSPCAALVRGIDWRLRWHTPPVFTLLCCMSWGLVLGMVEGELAKLDSLPEPGGMEAAVRAASARDVLLLPLLFVPPGLMAFVGVVLGKLTVYFQPEDAISPFLATRPVSTTTLVFAKMRFTAEFALVIWALLLPAAVGGFLLAGRTAQVAEREFVHHWGPGGAVLILALLIAALVILTWTQLLKGVWVGLSGSHDIEGASMLLTFTLGIAVVIVIWMLQQHPEWWESFLVVASWLAKAAVVLKLAAAGWVLRIVARRRLMPAWFPDVLVAGWAAVVVGLTALSWTLFGNDWVPPNLLALGVILFVPLTRIAIAPLAVEWNRHR
jgi:hypothetical protein